MCGIAGMGGKGDPELIRNMNLLYLGVALYLTIAFAFRKEEAYWLVSLFDLQKWMELLSRTNLAKGRKS